MPGKPKDEVPVVPRAFGKLAGARRAERFIEGFIAQCGAKGLHIGVSADIHDLSDQPVPILNSAFRGLPPDVLAGEGKKVHGAILHGRRQSSVLVSIRLGLSGWLDRHADAELGVVFP